MLCRLCLLFCAIAGVAPAFSAADQPLLFVSNERSGDVSVIDPNTAAVIRTFPVGKRPRGIHVGATTGRVYVAVSGSPRMGPGADPERAKAWVADKSADGIAIVEPGEGRVVRMLRVGSDPEQFALTADEQRIVVANEDAAEASVWQIETGARLATFPVGEEPEGVTLRPGHDEAWVTSEETGEVHVLDLARRREFGRLGVGGRPRSVAFSADGATAYVPSETDATLAIVDADQRKVSHTVLLRAPRALPMMAVTSPDGRRVFVSTGRGNSVAVVDAGIPAVTSWIAVGERAWGLALSPDGARLYTANGGTNDVSVVDTVALKEIARVRVGDGPWGLAVGHARH